MTLRSFSLRIFQHCPLLAPFSVENHTRAFEEFLQYKTRVPVRGAILLNEAMDSTVLVKGWKKGANWSFPRGKINKDEDDLECAIREVYEETGYDLHAAGLVPKDRDVKHIEITMREQQMRLYVFRNVPMDTHFAPRTRKEISKIQWYRLSELPAFRRKGTNANDQNDAAAAANANKFYMVAPFLVPLKKWVVQQKKKESRMAGAQAASHALPEELATEDDGWAQSYSSAPKSTQTHTSHTLALDTLEGATEELQRLLKGQQIQEPISSTTPRGAPDKGASLLAMLKASSQVSTSSTSLPGVMHKGATTYGMQHNHSHDYGFQHQQQVPAPSQVQNPQHWHSQGGSLGVHAHQQPSSTALGHGHVQAPLRHPQPLPPQVHINRAGFLNTLQPSPQNSNIAEAPAPMTQPGQVSYSSRPRPSTLSSHSLALLQTFSIGSAPSSNPPGASATPQPSAPATNNALVVNPTPNAGDNTYGAHGGVGQPRPSQVTNQQRATLLNMFKKTETARTDENQQPQHSASEALIRQMMAVESTHRMDGASSSRPSPQDIALMSRIQRPAYDSGSPGQTSIAMSPASHHVTPSNLYRSLPSDPKFTAAPANHERPTSLTSPPATSSLPTPAILQRKQSMSHEQRNKLLSLFGKPQTLNPGASAVDEHGRGKEVALPAASPMSATSGSALHLSESRRGSQTPISPADRSFLLNYLASATSKAQ